MMDYIGWINAEGGPLLLTDAALAASWQGSSGTDYERACGLFDAHPGIEGTAISVGAGMGILWEMSGPGTAHVFRDDESHYVIVRPWPTDPTNYDAPRLMAEQASTTSVEIGPLSTESRVLLILWAVEDGPLVESPQTTEPSRPTGEKAIEDSGLLVPLRRKAFRCFHDQVETSVGTGRRLHLRSDA
jgi:hypothetical protein